MSIPKIRKVDKPTEVGYLRTYFAGITKALSPAHLSHSLRAALPKAPLGSAKSKLIRSSAKQVLINGFTQKPSFLPAWAAETTDV